MLTNVPDINNFLENTEIGRASRTTRFHETLSIKEHLKDVLSRSGNVHPAILYPLSKNVIET